MVQYDNRRYSAEMPPDYRPRDFLKFLADTALDGEKDTVHSPKERWQLFAHRERLSDVVAQLTASHSIGQRRRATLLFQALESACVILSLRIEQPVVRRQMKDRADHARDVKKLVSQQVDKILVALATPIWRQYPNDSAWLIAGKIQPAVIAAFKAEHLGDQKQLPREQQAIARRLKNLRHLIHS